MITCVYDAASQPDGGFRRVGILIDPSRRMLWRDENTGLNFVASGRSSKIAAQCGVPLFTTQAISSIGDDFIYEAEM